MVVSIVQYCLATSDAMHLKIVSIAGYYNKSCPILPLQFHPIGAWTAAHRVPTQSHLAVSAPLTLARLSLGCRHVMFITFLEVMLLFKFCAHWTLCLSLLRCTSGLLAGVRVPL
jgi:hypothetical protein